jgi:hypothetical protein
MTTLTEVFDNDDYSKCGLMEGQQRGGSSPVTCTKIIFTILLDTIRVRVIIITLR